MSSGRFVLRLVQANAVFAFLGLLIWTALLRLPFWRHSGIDEIFFAVIGREWLHGGLPYVASFDVKPPGLFALFVLTQLIPVGTILPIKLLGCVAVAASSTGLFLIGRKYFSPEVSLFTALLYPFCTLFLSGTDVLSETLQEPFEIFAVLLLLAPSNQWSLRRIAIAGMLLGTAAMIRQPAVFDLAALGLVVFILGGARRYVRVVYFLAGAAFVPLCFLLYYLVAGHVRELLDATFLGALARQQGDTTPFYLGIFGFFLMQRPMVGLLALTMLLWVHRDLVRQAGLARPVAIIACWLGGSALGVIAVRSMYDHYFLTLIPAMLLLSAVFVFHAGGKLTAWAGNAAPALLLAAVIVPPLVYVVMSPSIPGDDLAVEQRAAERLRTDGLVNGDRILVLDGGLPIYLYANATPAVAVFHPEHLLCPFPGAGADPMVDALASTPKFIVIKRNNTHISCEMPQRVAELERTLRDRYTLADTVRGPDEAFELFRLRSSQASR
jgi:hypothetical protein